MPDTLPEDLAGFVGARICHDVVNPLGAIGNGVELLQLASTGPSPELELLDASVRNAQARVRFLRLAFGPASAATPTGAAETRALLRDYSRGLRHNLLWEIDGDLPRTDQRLAFLMLLCAISALPLGGQIILAQADARLTLTAKAPRIAVNTEDWAALKSGRRPAQTTPATVHFALLAAEIAARIESTGQAPDITASETELRFIC